MPLRPTCLLFLTTSLLYNNPLPVSAKEISGGSVNRPLAASSKSSTQQEARLRQLEQTVSEASSVLDSTSSDHSLKSSEPHVSSNQLRATKLAIQLEQFTEALKAGLKGLKLSSSPDLARAILQAQGVANDILEF